MEYFPSKSVEVLLFVPLIVTETPGNGPRASETTPEIFCSVNFKVVRLRKVISITIPNEIIFTFFMILIFK